MFLNISSPFIRIGPTIMVNLSVGIAEHDNEGRVITAEYEDFFLVTSCELLSVVMIFP